MTNICNNLEKIIESATSESKSHDNIIDDSSLNKKCQHTPEMNEMSDVIPEVPEINNYPTLEYIPQEYPFAFVLDYNTMCYLNSICYMTPSLPQNFVEKTINPSEIFSPKTSNFTVYKSQWIHTILFWYLLVEFSITYLCLNYCWILQQDMNFVIIKCIMNVQSYTYPLFIEIWYQTMSDMYPYGN